MKYTLLKSLGLIACLGTVVMVSGCEDRDYDSYDRSEAVEVETYEAEDAASAAEPAVADVPDVAPEPSADAVPVDTLPSETRTSSETVQPESETLFY